MVNVLFSAGGDLWSEYEGPLTSAFDQSGIEAKLTPHAPPEEVDYIVFAPNGPVQDFTPFTRVKAVLGLWAGVENMVVNKTLTQPLARMVDPGLAKGMAEWVTGHVLRYHLGLDADILNPAHEWVPRVPALAEERTVAVLGVGELGNCVGNALNGLGFNVVGWSRRAKPGSAFPVNTGSDGLRDTLGIADFVVLLLPLTAATRNILDKNAFAGMKKGCVLLNPGRGPLIDDEALLIALDDGTVSFATLDVFRQEPLPTGHAFWSHPKITVTPHIASATRPGTAALVIAENIRRCEAGLPLLHLVDRDAGY